VKRRYTIYLSRKIAERFNTVARVNGAKSALVEQALDRHLDPERTKTHDEALLRRMDGLSHGLSTIERDVAIATETLSLFVRYYLTVTPPVAKDDHDAARATGRQRFEKFVAQVGQRLASDRRLVSEVLESIVANNPDLLAAAIDDAAASAKPARTEVLPFPAPAQPKAQSAAPSQEDTHHA
jgi:AcrR family transcriptional regulator